MMMSDTESDDWIKLSKIIYWIQFKQFSFVWLTNFFFYLFFLAEKNCSVAGLSNPVLSLSAILLFSLTLILVCIGCFLVTDKLSEQYLWVIRDYLLLFFRF